MKKNRYISINNFLNIFHFIAALSCPSFFRSHYRVNILRSIARVARGRSRYFFHFFAYRRLHWR